MKRIKNTLGYSAIFAAVVTVGAVVAGASTPARFKTVAKYFFDKSGGTIVQSPGDWSDLTFFMLRSERFGNTVTPPKFTHEAIARGQDAFHLDVEGFTRKMGAEDFLDAKYGYYQQLTFDPKTQLHERPYYYLYSWGSLFHPPIKELTLPLERYSKHFAPIDLDQRAAESTYFDPQFQHDIDAMTDTQLTAGNKLKLLPDQAAYKEKVRIIRAAKKYLFTASLVYLCDSSTKVLVSELVAAKNRGVDVKVISEGITSLIDGGCMRKMQNEGLDVMIISDIFKPGSNKGVMHNKLWLRDGEEAIMGGQNIMNAENESTGFNFKNRDTDLLVSEGPIISDLHKGYIELWDNYRSQNNGVAGKYLPAIQMQIRKEFAAGKRGRKNYANWLGNPDTRMNGLCRMAMQRSGADRQPIAPIIYEHIHEAKHTVFINSPTFEFLGAPEGQERREWYDIMKGLMVRKSNEHGVDFEIVTNGFEGGNGEAAIMARELFEKFQASGKTWLSNAFRDVQHYFSLGMAQTNRDFLTQLNREKNIHSWLYFGYNHSKIFIFDRIGVSVGSFNFDLFSSERAHETQLFCYDKALVQETESYFLRDLVNSIPVTSLFAK